MSVDRDFVLGKLINDGFPGSLEMPLPGLFTKIAMTGQSMALGEVPYVDEVIPASVFAIHAHAVPGRRVVVEFTNVTERKNAEKQVAEKHEALTKALHDLWGEMDLARKIQTVLLPSEPLIAGYEVSAEMRPASTVGGDYFDVFEAGGAAWLLVGDVSGHGVSAGLIMMMAQTAVRTAISGLANGEAPSPSKVLAQVNAAIRGNVAKIGKDQYMTISALCLRDGVVRHAGLHQDMLVYRAATGKVDSFETNGVWLGVVDDAAPLLSDAAFEIAEGDVLLAFSDGIVEAKIDGTIWGQANLAALFSELASKQLPTSEIVKVILDKVASEDQRDDQTLLVARRKGKKAE
ncbi:MAG: SpoIIE family protein phosphatase [Polyangiaceae bacterium]